MPPLAPALALRLPGRHLCTLMCTVHPFPPACTHPPAFPPAQIENCNRSASCCDAFDDATGSCATSVGQEEGEGSPYFCAAPATPGQVMRAVGATTVAMLPISSLGTLMEICFPAVRFLFRVRKRLPRGRWLGDRLDHRFISPSPCRPPPLACACSRARNAVREQTWAFETDEDSVQPPQSGVLSADYSSSETALRLPSSAVVVPRESALAGGWGSGVSRACGPALRLTSSRPASAGAAWYGRDITVGEVGADTAIVFG